MALTQVKYTSPAHNRNRWLRSISIQFS